MKTHQLFSLVALLFAATISVNAYAAPPTVVLTTASLNAQDINQGTSGAVVYATFMKVTDNSTTVTSIKFKIDGTFDNNDLTNVYIYFNPSSPVISGASYLGGATATFEAGHKYTININRSMAEGTSGYFIVTVNLSSSANDNKKININGATDPVAFDFSGSKNLTDNQSNKADGLTIQAADITLTTPGISEQEVNQGSTGVIVYATKMNVKTMPATANNITFKLGGNYDNNDLTNVYIYFNPSSVSISGASYLGGATATFAAPHTYSININKAMTENTSGYFIVTVNLSSSANDEKRIEINGADDPVKFTYTTNPNNTNTQKNSAKGVVIQAADVTLTTPSISEEEVNQGSTGNIVYAAKMNVKTMPTTVSNITLKLIGNYDNNDLSNIYLYFNPSSVSISGASYLGGATATFSAPHTYSINVNRSMAENTSGYFIVTVNVSNTATDNRTVQIDGNENPLKFTYSTAPNSTNNQKNSADGIIIQAADIALTTGSTNASNMAKGSTGNIVYAAKMSVKEMPVSVTNMTFKLDGSYDNNDLTNVYLYFNPSAISLTGASYLGGSAATFSGPHTYSININKSMNINDNGYFIVTVNVNATATGGNTVKINGADDPIQFSFGTAPNVADDQSNKAGTRTISGSGAKPGETSKSDIYTTPKSGNTLLLTTTELAINDLYPNPAINLVTYQLISPKAGKATIQLVDANGRQVFNTSVNLAQGNNKLTLNVTTFLNGTYQLMVIGENGKQALSKKIIVQH